MLTRYLQLLSLAAIASCAFLSPIHERSMEHQKGLKEDLSFSYRGPHVDGVSYRSSDLAKRDHDFVKLPLFKRGEYYTTELYMGSRGERIEVGITMDDTGLRIIDGKRICRANMKNEVKSKHEVPEDENGTDDINKSGKEIPSFPHLSKQEEDCKAWGAFNKAKSKTFKSLQDSMGLDKVGTSKTMVKMIFEVGNHMEFRRGYFGLGCGDETLMKKQIEGKYTNFPEALKNAGYIKKSAYSLFLNGQEDNSGSILFGAVDHRKYVGKLQTVPMLEKFPLIERSPILLLVDKIYLENYSQEVVFLKQGIMFWLTPSSTKTSLPDLIFRALAGSMSGKRQSKSDVYQVDCAHRISTGNLVYEFSGIKIKVPLKDLVDESNGVCYLAVRPSKGYYSYLTNSVLRHIYLTVDLEKREVSMAQAKLSELEDIEKINTSVPRAVKAERYSSTITNYYITQTWVEPFKIEIDE